MITEQDLREAIAECEGVRHPTSSTCIKLAAYYAILKYMQSTNETEAKPVRYSFETRDDVKYSNSEFSQIVKEKGLNNCFPVIDEIIGVLGVINPAVYHNALQKLRDI